ncbi:MAG TPA: carboxypeptidase regulatory-like domain-containing protein [Longimicrobiaceae bacterium]|jgi:hypothetical protein|nr:carboxypeptidase regulatory-like domain-containing protein [Longimicrobiaceae bacterium]
MPTTWDTTRRQVALAGMVTDAETGRPLGGARVEITAGPAAFRRWADVRAREHAGGSATVQAPHLATTSADGHFRFADLPDGAYTLAVSLPPAGSRYGAVKVKAAVAREGERVVHADAGAALPPTRIRGKVTGADGEAVAMAQVALKGGGEQALTGADGRYVLNAIEAGTRTVVVSARGHAPAAQEVKAAAGKSKTADFSLVRAGS